MDFSNTIRSKLLPALAAFALFFVVSAAYFAPQFRGEALPQHDVIQYEGMAKDISDMRAATGEDPQWTGGMFGGMPAYLINVAYPAQLVKRTVGQVVKIIDTPAGFLFFAMVSMWLMLLIVGINPWVGIVAALAYGLSTYFLLIIGAGHVTKMCRSKSAPTTRRSPIISSWRWPHSGSAKESFLSGRDACAIFPCAPRRSSRRASWP